MFFKKSLQLAKGIFAKHIFYLNFNQKTTLMQEKKLERSRTNRVLGGVSSAFADYFGMDLTLIRLAFVLLAIFGGSGVIIYIICWIVIPEKPNLMNVPFYGNPEAQNQPQGFTTAEGEEPTINEHRSDYYYNKSETTKPATTNQNTNIWLGVIFLVLGGLFLAHNLLEDFDFGKYWPILLIAVGILLLSNLKTNKNNEIK
jgi:phage shock protein PspC (stress-responsive transcriptional regulator)